MANLDNKIALITGSDSGIGQAIAEEFARAGADIGIAFLNDKSGAEETSRRVQEKGRRALVHRVDVTSEASVKMWFAEIEAALGVPHILVNSAGVVSGGSPVSETTTEDFDKVIKTDLYGPFFCAREFIRQRRAAGGRGKIINITSIHEAIPSPGSAAYGAAKGGLLTLTRSLSLELAPLRINVNAIAPGLIRTPMTSERVDDPSRTKDELPHIPWGRPGTPSEVARLATYLASDDSDYVTGQSFTIDGGLKMNWGQGA